MRICMYTDSALPMMGGQEVVIDALARQFQALGHEPVVLAPHPGAWPRTDDSHLPYPVYRHWRFFSLRFFVGSYCRFLCQLHRRLRFDVLHCHALYPPAYLAGLSRAELNIPYVVTSHGGDVNPDSLRLAKPGLRERYAAGLRAADALVANSRFTREGFCRLCPDPALIVDIPNGVDLAPFAERARRPATLDQDIKSGEYLLFLGRLRKQKGVDVLLRALTGVPESEGVQLVVAGEGEYRSELEALCCRLCLEPRVRFVGQVLGQDKVYLLQNALATVVPSRWWEAFGLVVLESYAAGRPVIVSDLPGLADNVQPGRTGFIVPPEAPELLARELRKAFANPERMRDMGVAGRQLARGYAWEIVAQRHVELYRQLIAARTGRRLAA